MKMRLIKVILLSFILVVTSTSCHRLVEIDSLEKQLFLEETQIGCFKDGHDYLVYSEAEHQLCINPRRHTFRIQSDNQFEYCHVDMESYPRYIGLSVILVLDICRENESVNYTLLFECSKIENGLIWLWNKESKLGIILPEH